MYIIEIVNNQNPLLNQVVIKNEKLNFHGIIYPNLGASLQKLSLNSIDLINGIPNNSSGLNDYKNTFKSAFLFPFPNRISEGNYEFNQTKYELVRNDTALNNALHGHIYDKPFFVKSIEATENIAIVALYYADEGKTKGFPFPYETEIVYAFSPGKIAINFQVFNIGENSFPFGIGWHPYFKVTNLATSNLDFEAESQYLLDEKMIPKYEIPLKFKTPLRIENTVLDDCFITNKPTVSFKCDDYEIDIDYTSKTENNYLQIYTPPTRDCIAVEPMTCAPDAFNNKNGLLVLGSQEKFKWGIFFNYKFLDF